MKIFYLELGQLGGLVLGVCGFCIGLALLDIMTTPLKWAWGAGVVLSLFGSGYCWRTLRWHRSRLRRSRSR